jgi:hypothetical protein
VSAPVGAYREVPDKVVDLRPPVRSKARTAACLALLALYFRLNAYV